MALSKEKAPDLSFIVEKDEQKSDSFRQVFRANFRKPTKEHNDVEQWLQQFKKETNTDWIVKEGLKGLQK